jgi:hypothetical protein
VYTGFWLTWTVLWDDGAHVRVYERLPVLYGSDSRLEWPGNKGKLFWEDWPGGDFFRVIYDFIFLNNRPDVTGAGAENWRWSLPVPFQPGNGTDGHLDWPRDFNEVPLPLNGTWIWHWDDPVNSWMPGWLRRIAYPYNGHLDIPAITSDYILPIAMLIGLPVLLILILRKLGWARTTRDSMIALFTGFIVLYVGLTIIGVAFRGRSQQLVPPTHVPNLEGDPHIQRQIPATETPIVLIDTRSGAAFHG